MDPNPPRTHAPQSAKTLIHITPGDFPEGSGPNCAFGECVVTVVVHGPDGKDTAAHLTVMGQGKHHYAVLTVANRQDVTRKVQLRPWKLPRAKNSPRPEGGAR